MKSVTFFFFLGVIGSIVLTQAAEDYCSDKFCKSGEQHIACNNSGDFTKHCPKDRKLIEINEELKALILELHNTLRNDLAGGKVSGYKEATRMASMTWDNELAELATMHVKNCTFEHDECHATLTFKYSGQNLAQTWYSGTEPSHNETVTDLINSWWEEKADANMDVINKYPSKWTGEEIGHFTAMSQDDNIKCGCGMLWLIDPEMEDMDSVLMTCNYATTNIINRSVYEAGKVASKCTTGTHPTYKNLCSSKESY